MPSCVKPSPPSSTRRSPARSRRTRRSTRVRPPPRPSSPRSATSRTDDRRRGARTRLRAPRHLLPHGMPMRSTATGWLLLLPTIIVLVVMGVFPFIYVLVISFFDWNAFAADPTMRFAGLENYRRLVFDPQFLTSLWLTLQFALLRRRQRAGGRLPAGAADDARVPAQGPVPHHPHLAADGGADRGRRHLAAAHRPRPRAGALLSGALVRHRVPDRHLSRPGLRHHHADGSVALDAADHADADGRPVRRCPRSRSSRRRSTAPTAGRPSGTSPCRC